MAIQQSIVREAQNVIGQLLAPGLEDPYPLYAWLRENAPVVYSERHDAYLLSRYRDCELAFRAPQLFRSEENDTLLELLPQAVEHPEYRALFASLTGSALPYTPLRRMIAQLLTPDVVRFIRDGMRRITDGVAQAVAEADDGSPIDLHSALSVPVTERSLSALVGVPMGEMAEATTLIRRLIRAMEAAPTRSAVTAAATAYQAVADYVRTLLDAYRKAPQGNLATMLVRSGGSNGAGPRLSDEEVCTTLITLWTAGIEKGIITIDTSALAILRKPNLIEWIRDEETAGAFVDELYRWDSPGQLSNSLRYAGQDIDLGGHVIPAGAGVRMLLGAANRDPEAYPDPDRLMPSRVGPPPLLSGAQPCVGTGLARMQLAVVLPHLFERFPDLCLAGEPVWRRSLPLREPRSIPVRLGVSTGSRSGVPVGVGAR
jgi:cytochrome P450 family 114